MALTDTLMERRKQGAVDEIAATALELFSRDGFEATSVEAIAAATGCAPRTFYRYFGTKEHVVFHDLPALIEQVRESLDGHLADGLGPWTAVTESVVEFISRFDPTDGRRLIPTQRMSLWLNEPALRARYMQYVSDAEHVITDCLCRHRGTIPEEDDRAQLIAVAATGATRVVIATHTPSRKLTKHLREALATLGKGLADEAV